MCSSDDWKSVLEPITKRHQDKDIIRYFRWDAAFANPGINRLLEMKDLILVLWTVSRAAGPIVMLLILELKT